MADVVGTGVGAQGAVLAHGKGLVHALSVHHPQLKGAVGVERLALGGTAVGAGVGAVAVVLPVVAGGGDDRAVFDFLIAAVAISVTGIAVFGAGRSHITFNVGSVAGMVVAILCSGPGLRVVVVTVAVTGLHAGGGAGGGGGHFPFAPIMCVGVFGDGLRVNRIATGTLHSLGTFGGAGGRLGHSFCAVEVMAQGGDSLRALFGGTQSIHVLSSHLRCRWRGWSLSIRRRCVGRLPSRLPAKSNHSWGVAASCAVLIAALILVVAIFPTGSIFMLARQNAFRFLANIFAMDNLLQFIVLSPCTKSPHRRQWFSSNQRGSFLCRWLQCNRAAILGRLFQLQQHIVLNFDFLGIDISFVT